MADVEMFVIGVVCGMGLLYTLWKATPRVLRAFGYHIARSGAEKQAAVHRKAVVCVDAAFDYARAQADLAEEVGGELPKSFDPMIHYSQSVAAACERELVLQAEREGIIQAGVADRLFGERFGTAEPRPPEAYEPEPEEAPANVTRIGGRLLHRRRSG